MSSERALPAGLLPALRAALHPGAVIDDRDRLVSYEADALTTSKGLPGAAVFPADRDELIQVIRLLHEARVPFVARGAGTGLAGGAVATGGVLVCTTRMHRILEVDAVGRTALVEPGALTDSINAAAKGHGLRYLPDPASSAACTIGGNVALNSGGPHCLKHGVTTDHVAALEMILPDGTPLVVGRGEDGGLDLAGQRLLAFAEPRFPLGEFLGQLPLPFLFSRKFSIRRDSCGRRRLQPRQTQFREQCHCQNECNHSFHRESPFGRPTI